MSSKVKILNTQSKRQPSNQSSSSNLSNKKNSNNSKSEDADSAVSKKVNYFVSM
jgi:hypothetical protein